MDLSSVEQLDDGAVAHDRLSASLGPNESSTSSADLAGQEQDDVGKVHKRRRVTRACDECRRKKIKCDGKQPCGHCSVYSYGTQHLHANE